MIDFTYKIQVPQRPAHLVSRPRLNELLGAIVCKRLLGVSGPPGYGKTSLMVDFAAVSPLPVCWYALDPSDHDPWVFLDYFVASIEQRFPGTTARTAALLAANSRISFPTIVSMLVRECHSIAQDFVVILDDWHVVDHVPEIKDIVTHLLLHCPRCHVMLASRCCPSLPNMMLLTARRQMSSFSECHLRFSAAEAASVLEAGYGTPVCASEVSALTEQAQGWITGILLSYQTASLAPSEPLFRNTLAERQIYRYMLEQVFEQQAAEIQDFLLDSALLEELTPESCDGVFQRNDSRRMLERMLRQHLFISEIRPGVLRYHSLFREFLQEHYRTMNPRGYQMVARQVAHFGAPEVAGAGTSALSAREIDILRLLGEGHDDQRIGEMLGISERTVRYHLRNTYDKLGVQRRGEAIAWAVRRRWT